METEIPGRWNHLKFYLERNGPMDAPDFEPNPMILDFMLNQCKILVVGAGGLGCELLKDICLSGFRNIHVIDMDTIDLSNLNRQFLFRQADIGKPKADVAAAFINKRIPGANVTPHYCKIQDFDASFYRQFHLVICGLDSILARRWMNGMLHSLLEYDEDGNLEQHTLIPMVDGGTEGFKGNVRVILPGMTACVECTLELYPPQRNFPMCTIAHTPRQPEHCIEYAKMFSWEKEKPFGDRAIDGDDPKHINWLLKVATERADEYGIQGVTYRLTQGVIKRIIPAVASTNAVIAAACTLEAFKLASSCFAPLNNFMVFNDSHGVYTYTYEAERSESCVTCTQKTKTISFKSDAHLREITTYLCEEPSLQMKKPGLTTTINGANKTLYMPTVKSIEEATRPNLSKSLKELGLVDGQELMVADITTPNALIFKLQFSDDAMS